VQRPWFKLTPCDEGFLESDPRRQVGVFDISQPAARVWEARSGMLIEQLRGHTDQVTSAVFSADGKTLLTASKDGVARIFPCALCGSLQDLLALAQNRVQRELTCEERQAYLHEEITCASAAPTATPTK